MSKSLQTLALVVVGLVVTVDNSWSWCFDTKPGQSKQNPVFPVECREAGDCMEHFLAGYRKSGVYTIRIPTGESGPTVSKILRVYCEMTDTNGWTVLQRRQSGNVNFQRNWDDYKNGFGDASGEYWIGNDAIHALTTKSSTPTRMRVDLRSNANGSRHAEYGSFSVASESQKYQLSVSGYSGDAGNSMLVAAGMPFTTRDQDNDFLIDRNCADLFVGGWWFNKCYAAFLNGPYGQSGKYGKGIAWNSFLGLYNFMDYADMKITYDN